MIGGAAICMSAVKWPPSDLIDSDSRLNLLVHQPGDS